MTASTAEPRLAAVVIGRNEGQRLVECIASIREQIADIVYVDSGSSDGSPERAEAAGARCIRLETGPYTAARGRQAGVELLSESAPEFILFVDGDCVLDAGFVTAALEHMDGHPRTGAVAGRRREAGSGFWSRVIDIEWDTTPGEVAHVGGDSLMRLAAVREAGGWPIDVIAGEEPDLCLRMKDHGWESHRIPVEMTLHDIRMKRFGQYWKRSVRAGHAYAEVAWRRRKGEFADRFRAVASIVLYSVALPTAIAASAVLFWPVAAVLSLLYVRVIVSMTMRTMRSGRGFGLSAAYAVLTVIGKFAGLVGVLRFAFGLLTGKRSRIIEYNVPTAGAAERSSVSLGKTQ